ncbi:MAG: polysaccharide deacetylase family protein [Solirubrobacteraceae bacterium]
MNLLVEAPAGREPERRYILDVVLADWLGLQWRLAVTEREDVRLTREGDAQGRSVVMPDVLFATPSNAWLERSSLPASPVPWRDGLPVLYGRASLPGDALIRIDGDTAELSVDVFGSAFFMLSRYEELAVPERDERGRFAATASVAHREGFLQMPIVDAYVDLLWEALQALWPALDRRPRRYRVALTHDVDDPLAVRGRTAGELARQLGADVLVRRDGALLVRRLRSWGGAMRGVHGMDPYNTFDFLMDVSERHGLTSAFYFMAPGRGADGAAALRYSLDDPWIELLLRRIHARGHEIGLHAIDLDPSRTRSGFAELRRAAERNGIHQDLWGGRQHFLRWENPSTWATWEQAGLDYDTTLSFADRIGFRAGTCHEYRVFDVLQRRALRLRERPFQAMDRTLFEYMGLGDEPASAAVLNLAARCRRHGGVLSLLWHNDVVATAPARRWYERVVDAVSAGSQADDDGRRALERDPAPA